MTSTKKLWQLPKADRKFAELKIVELTTQIDVDCEAKMRAEKMIEFYKIRINNNTAELVRLKELLK